LPLVFSVLRGCVALPCNFLLILEFVGFWVWVGFCLLFGCGVRGFGFTRMFVFWGVGYISELDLCLSNFGTRLNFAEFFVDAICALTVSSLFSIACCLREEQEFAFVA
jgi:hypothetical protein